jgi:hypothetical protein
LGRKAHALSCWYVHIRRLLPCASGHQFAELLNQKKSKLAQLQQQVTELSATVEKLRVAAQVGVALGCLFAAGMLVFCSHLQVPATWVLVIT